jgi:TetR/AcrR family transcriptional regulator, ethionamide resistance regulator
MATRARTGKPTRRQRQEKGRALLLGAAQRLLSRGESFSALSIGRLAAEAGIPRTRFYVYFEDKNELLRVWFEYPSVDVARASTAWWRLDGNSSKEDLRLALRGLVETYRPHHVVVSAMLDAATTDPAIREALNAMMAGNTANLREHIERGQREGWVDRRLLAAETAAWLSWGSERGVFQLPPDAVGAELDRVVDAYTEFVWRILYAPARVPEIPGI